MSEVEEKEPTRKGDSAGESAPDSHADQANQALFNDSALTPSRSGSAKPAESTQTTGTSLTDNTRSTDSTNNPSGSGSPLSKMQEESVGKLPSVRQDSNLQKPSASGLLDMHIEGGDTNKR